MRERKVNIGSVMPIIEERLADGAEVLFSPNGVSMLPTLKSGRDTVVLISPPSRLRKYDIALFKSGSGQYVLHRVISVGETYTFIGDNKFEYERDIAKEDIIALCIAYERGGRRVRLDTPTARAFAMLWHGIRPLRRLYLAIKRRIKALFKK